MVFVDPQQWWRHSGSLFRHLSVTFWLKFVHMVISHLLSMGLVLQFTCTFLKTLSKTGNIVKTKLRNDRKIKAFLTKIIFTNFEVFVYTFLYELLYTQRHYQDIPRVFCEFFLNQIALKHHIFYNIPTIFSEIINF